MLRNLPISHRHRRMRMNLSSISKDIKPPLPLSKVSSAFLKPVQSTNSKSFHRPLINAFGWPLWTTLKLPAVARLSSNDFVNLVRCQYLQRSTPCRRIIYLLRSPPLPRFLDLFSYFIPLGRYLEGFFADGSIRLFFILVNCFLFVNGFCVMTSGCLMIV